MSRIKLEGQKNNQFFVVTGPAHITEFRSPDLKVEKKEKAGKIVYIPNKERGKHGKDYYHHH